MRKFRSSVNYQIIKICAMVFTKYKTYLKCCSIRNIISKLENKGDVIILSWSQVFLNIYLDTEKSTYLLTQDGFVFLVILMTNCYNIVWTFKQLTLFSTATASTRNMKSTMYPLVTFSGTNNCDPRSEVTGKALFLFFTAVTQPELNTLSRVNSPPSLNTQIE